MISLFLGLAILAATLCGILGGWVASQKGRTIDEGALLGFFFGFSGVLTMPAQRQENCDAATTS
jgi:hypothetical protein